LTRLQDRLRHLTAAEQAVLRGFIGGATRTQSLYWMNGVVVGLEAEKIIYNTAPYGREGLPCPYNMQNWAFTHLNEHPELIGLDRSQIGAPTEVRGIGHVQQEYRDRVRMALQNGRLKGYTVGLDEERRFTVASYQEWEAAGAPTEPLASKEAHVE
jgi:Super-infection exclusion protein B